MTRKAKMSLRSLVPVVWWNILYITEQLNKGHRVLIQKQPHSLHLLVRDLYVNPKLEQRQWAVIVISFLPGHIFWTRSYSFFKFLYLILGEHFDLSGFYLRSCRVTCSALSLGCKIGGFSDCGLEKTSGMAHT